jgi:hypothetical protein
VSEELEHSLQQAVETYLNDRLRTIDEQLSKLQTDVNQALSQLREGSHAESLDGTALSASIFAHLQTARGQKLSGATLSAPSGQEAAAIRRATEEIERHTSQTDILASLLKSASQFAERVALFVIKNDQAIGWRVCRASDAENLEMIGGVSLPLSSETIVTRATNSKSSQAADIRSNAREQLLIDQLGGEPQFATAVPLIVRGKVVAVLYADSTSSEANAINEDAVEILARVASMAVGLAALHRAATAAQEAPTAKQAEAVSQSEPASMAEPVSMAEPAAAREPESTYTPQVEPQTAESMPEAAAEEPSVATEAVASPPTEITPEVAEPEAAAPAEVQTLEEPAVSTQPEAAETEVEIAPRASVTEPAPTAAADQTPAQFLSEYAAPLGSARRFGVSEPELPIEVSEEERRLHNDARRFARLLVSEIKLYNEPKVKEGRSAGDLYDRLREDIDRSRQMYDKRVAPPVAARHDYFHQELVNMLAEGDAAKLGANYQKGTRE